jgi:hypothetical protein
MNIPNTSKKGKGIMLKEAMKNGSQNVRLKLTNEISKAIVIPPIYPSVI